MQGLVIKIHAVRWIVDDLIEDLGRDQYLRQWGSSSMAFMYII